MNVNVNVNVNVKTVYQFLFFFLLLCVLKVNKSVTKFQCRPKLYLQIRFDIFPTACSQTGQVIARLELPLLQVQPVELQIDLNVERHDLVYDAVAEAVGPGVARKEVVPGLYETKTALFQI